jgi:hypothetical protein
MRLTLGMFLLLATGLLARPQQNKPAAKSNPAGAPLGHFHRDRRNTRSWRPPRTGTPPSGRKARACGDCGGGF